jgi:hypothetical protein
MAPDGSGIVSSASDTSETLGRNRPARSSRPIARARRCELAEAAIAVQIAPVAANVTPIAVAVADIPHPVYAVVPEVAVIAPDISAHGARSKTAFAVSQVASVKLPDVPSHIPSVAADVASIVADVAVVGKPVAAILTEVPAILPLISGSCRAGKALRPSPRRKQSGQRSCRKALSDHRREFHVLPPDLQSSLVSLLSIEHTRPQKVSKRFRHRHARFEESHNVNASSLES